MTFNPMFIIIILFFKDCQMSYIELTLFWSCVAHGDRLSMCRVINVAVIDVDEKPNAIADDPVSEYICHNTAAYLW